MSETLLNQSVIRLYGRVVTDLKLEGASSQGAGATTALQSQLSAENAQLARVYGFEYEGHYYDMPRPAIFMVHGDGQTPAEAGTVIEPDPELEIEQAGIRVWTYDKADFSIRLDLETGAFEEILLAPVLSANQQLKTSGMNVKGMHVKGS